MDWVVMVGQRKDLLTCGLAVEPRGDVRMVDIVMSVRYVMYKVDCIDKITCIVYTYVCTYVLTYGLDCIVHSRSLFYYICCEEFNECYRLVSIWMLICLLLKNTLMSSELVSPLKAQP